MNKLNLLKLYGLLLIFVVSLSGCASQQVNSKSSVMEYLYPNSTDTFEDPSTPNLTLPLRVGVAFVPESKDSGSSHHFWAGNLYSGGIAEAKKSQILANVSKHFSSLDFVSSIEVIPSAYLTPGGSFANLSQIKTMYGIDVMALVSYDQVQFTDEGALSLSYWTIVGAYIVSGEKNDTNTLMDTVVYDIASKKMLFRAPGTSQVSGSSTPVNLSEELRVDSIKGFELAADNMTLNLEKQLTVFKQRLKDDPNQVTISHRDGYSGGGTLDLWDCVVLLLLSLLAWLRKRALNYSAVFRSRN